MNIWIVYGIYYEEDYYRTKVLMSAHKTVMGAIAALHKEPGPYEQFEIKQQYVRGNF